MLPAASAAAAAVPLGVGQCLIHLSAATAAAAATVQENRSIAAWSTVSNAFGFISQYTTPPLSLLLSYSSCFPPSILMAYYEYVGLNRPFGYRNCCRFGQFRLLLSGGKQSAN